LLLLLSSSSFFFLFLLPLSSSSFFFLFLLPVSSSSSFLAASSLARAASHIIPVSVGKNGLTFEPNEIHAAEGDVIEFRFWPRNHSVVAGDFHNARRPAENNGFFSGFFPTQNGTVNSQVFRVTINHANPMPIYCSQNNGQHCKNGMVAVINPAHDGSMTLDAYAALARNAGNATSPQGGVFGGVVAQNEAATSTSPSASTTTATTTETQAQSQPETTATTTTTGATGTGASATTTATNTPTAAAAGLAVPVAGLMAVAVGAFFV
ncbi:hypothetical protein N657DRAFT_306655, partial [Parathielavia appendiculata]